MKVTAQEHWYPLRLFNFMLCVTKENQTSSETISANHSPPAMICRTEALF